MSGRSAFHDFVEWLLPWYHREDADRRARRSEMTAAKSDMARARAERVIEQYRKADAVSRAANADREAADEVVRQAELVRDVADEVARQADALVDVAAKKLVDEVERDEPA